MFLRLLTLVTLLLAATTLSSAPLPFPRDRTKADLKAMQGEWSAVEYITWARSRAAPQPARVRHHGTTVTVAGDRLFICQGGEVVETQVFRLTRAAGPQWIDSYVLKLDGERNWNLTYHGVYELDGDWLTVCISTVGRPKAFAADVLGERLIVLKRVKK
jgi:uncharacterized protein (TIGR03067 family)